MVLFKALLKTGETIELPIDAMIDFVTYNRQLIQVQHSEKPFRPRRHTQNAVENITQ